MRVDPARLPPVEHTASVLAPRAGEREREQQRKESGNADDVDRVRTKTARAMEGRKKVGKGMGEKKRADKP